MWLPLPAPPPPKLSIELAARLGCGLIVAPFAAAMSFGGLKQVADLYNETASKHGQKPGRLMCSYFTHFADTKEQEMAQRARQIRYYKECVIPAFRVIRRPRRRATTISSTSSTGCTRSRPRT